MDIQDFNIILFDGFETLDAFGPAEIIGKLPLRYKLEYFSLNGGLVKSSQNIRVETLPFDNMNISGSILIPGGIGTRTLVNSKVFINKLNEIVRKAAFVLTVCTGSALLAKTDLLNGKKATTNKLSFEWVSSQNSTVNWKKSSRWVIDGNIYTSSGVSAGIDMTLGFIAEVHGEKTAHEVAEYIEYIWNSDKEKDPFAIL